MKKKLTAALIILSTINMMAQSDINAKFGKGINVVAQDSSMSLKFSTRIQTLYEGTQDFNANEWNDQILIRRARLKFEGYAFSENFTYKMELGLSNRDHGDPIDETRNTSRMILDAWVKWKFAKNWELLIGQAKLPSNRERLFSSASLQFVDRSLVNKYFTLDRDMGLQLIHKTSLGSKAFMKQYFALSMGEGRNITSDNIGGYDYTAKVEFWPLGAFTDKGDYFGSDLKRESEPKLAVAFVYDYEDGASRQRGQTGKFFYDVNGDYVMSDLTTMSADFLFKYNGLSLQSEYGKRINNDGIVGLDANGKSLKYASGNGIVASVGYLMENNWEFAVRYTKINADDLTISSLDEEKEYTFGISKYIVGHHLKVQSDVSQLFVNGQKDSFTFRLQVEMGI